MSNLQLSLITDVSCVGHRVTSTVGLMTKSGDEVYTVKLEVSGDDEMEIVSCVEAASRQPAPLAESRVLDVCRDSAWLWRRIDQTREQSALAWAV